MLNMGWLFAMNMDEGFQLIWKWQSNSISSRQLKDIEILKRDCKHSLEVKTDVVVSNGRRTDVVHDILKQSEICLYKQRERVNDILESSTLYLG